MSTRTPLSQRDLRIARALASVVSLVMIGLGAASIVGRVYSGYTARYGGSEVFLTGDRAMLMGAVYIALGLAPLGVWSRKPMHGLWWAVACLMAFLVLLGVLLYG